MRTSQGMLKRSIITRGISVLSVLLILLSVMPRCPVVFSQSLPLQASELSNAKVDERAGQVDALMAQWSKAGSPGAAVIVIRDGRVLLEKGYGLANIETGEPITTHTAFDLASVTKQFTAMCIMMLIERGRLKLDDRLLKFFPEFPAYARDITIRNLLNHTSGIPDYPNPFIISGKVSASWQKDWEPASFQPTSKEVVAMVAAQKSLDFAPGEKWDYSNSNYVILAQLVERISGKTFAQFLKENIFQPLAMTGTFVYDQTKPTIKNRATRYDRAPTGFKVIRDAPFDLIYGDSNIYSTVEDLYKWDQALYTESLVKRSLLRQAFTPGQLKNGEATSYGFGWVLDKYFGIDMTYHQGGGIGFSTFIMRIPEQHFTVVVLSNFARFNPFITGRRIARIYLADKLALPTAVVVSPEVLQSYVGSYQFTPFVSALVTLDGNVLHAKLPGQPGMILLPLSENEFFVKGEEDNLVTFHKDANGKVSGVTVLQVDIPINGKRIEAPARAPQP